MKHYRILLVCLGFLLTACQVNKSNQETNMEQTRKLKGVVYDTGMNTALGENIKPLDLRECQREMQIMGRSALQRRSSVRL